jgi:hypothetical protein
VQNVAVEFASHQHARRLLILGLVAATLDVHGVLDTRTDRGAHMVSLDTFMDTFTTRAHDTIMTILIVSHRSVRMTMISLMRTEQCTIYLSVLEPISQKTTITVVVMRIDRLAAASGTVVYVCLVLSRVCYCSLFCAVWLPTSAVFDVHNQRLRHSFSLAFCHDDIKHALRMFSTLLLTLDLRLFGSVLHCRHPKPAIHKLMVSHFTQFHQPHSQLASIHQIQLVNTPQLQ